MSASSYCIVYASTRNHLSEKVKSKIKQGWIPLGGVFVEPAQYIGKNDLGWDDWLRGDYLQSMIKYAS